MRAGSRQAGVLAKGVFTRGYRKNRNPCDQMEPRCVSQSNNTEDFLFELNRKNKRKEGARNEEKMGITVFHGVYAGAVF